jgi:hypothetical protein
MLCSFAQHKWNRRVILTLRWAGAWVQLGSRPICPTLPTLTSLTWRFDWFLDHCVWPVVRQALSEEGPTMELDRPVQSGPMSGLNRTSQEMIGQAFPNPWQVLWQDSACPITGQTWWVKYHSNRCVDHTASNAGLDGHIRVYMGCGHLIQNQVPCHQVNQEPIQT